MSRQQKGITADAIRSLQHRSRANTTYCQVQQTAGCICESDTCDSQGIAKAPDMLRRWQTVRDGIIISPTDRLVRRMPSIHARQPPCEVGCWCWSWSVVMLGFRTAGKWTVGSHSRVSSTGSAGVLRVSRNASGRRCNYFDVTDRCEVARGGIEYIRSIVYFRQFTMVLITTP